jgi:hypothetical protein
MFTIDQEKTVEELREKKLFKVFSSMNNHQVATPDTSLEEARSYVLIFREGKNKLSVYIGLHLLSTDRKLFYAHSENPFSEDGLEDVETEARNFAEDLGAMLDEVDFENMSDSERDDWMENQSIFSEKKPPEPESPEQSAQPEAAVAAPAETSTPVPVSDVQPPVAEKPPVPEVPTFVAPEPAEVYEQPVSQPQRAETPDMPQDAPGSAPFQQSEQTRSAPLAAAKRRQEITQKATAGIAKAVKQTAKKELPSADGVVGRDREALARLLTSF